MSNIFISYSRRNGDIVNRLHKELKKRNRDVWIDFEKIALTEEWWEKIKEGIEESENFVFIISPDSTASVICNFEISHALQYNKRLIPVLHQDVDESTMMTALESAQLDDVATKILGDRDMMTIARESWLALAKYNWIFLNDDNTFDDIVESLLKSIDTNLEHVRAHTHYLTAARAWEKANREDSLLFRGENLKNAEAWLTNVGDNEPIPTVLHVQFFQASRQAVAKRQKIALVTAIVVGFFLLISAGFSLFQYFRANENATRAQNNEATAIVERDRANRNAELAESGEQAAQAQLALNSDNYERALELAVRANAMVEPPVASQQILFQVVNSPGPRWSLVAHTQQVNTVAFHPTLELAISGASDRTAIIWDTTDGSVLHKLTGHADWINSVAFHPDGTRAYTASADGRIIEWDVEQGTLLRILEGQSGGIRDIAIDPEGRRLVAIGCATGDLIDCVESQILLWDLSIGMALPTSETKISGLVESIAVHPNGTQVILGTDRGEIRRWLIDNQEMELVHDRHAGESNPAIRGIAISANGNWLASASSDRKVVIWDLENNGLHRILAHHAGPVRTVVFSPDSRWLVSGSIDKSVLVTTVETGALLERFIGHTGEVTSVSFDRSNRYILSGALDGIVRIWDLSSISQIRHYGQSDAAYGVAYDDATNRLLFGDNKGKLTVLDTSDIDQLTVQQQFDIHTGSIFDIEISPDRSVVAVSSFDGQVSIWDMNSFERITSLNEHTEPIWDSAFSPDGTTFTTASADDTLIVWDTAQWEKITTLADHDDIVLTVTYSPDGTKLISGSADYTIIVRETSNWSIIKRLDKHTNWVWDVEVSPDSQTMLSASEDSTIIYWDLETLEPIGDPISVHTAQVTRVAFSPKGDYFLSGSRDRSIIVWQLNPLRQLYTLIGSDDAVWGFEFSGEQTFFSTNSDGTVREWLISLSTETLLTSIEQLESQLRIEE